MLILEAGAGVCASGVTKFRDAKTWVARFRASWGSEKRLALRFFSRDMQKVDDPAQENEAS